MLPLSFRCSCSLLINNGLQCSAAIAALSCAQHGHSALIFPVLTPPWPSVRLKAGPEAAPVESAASASGPNTPAGAPAGRHSG